ncbi:MAG: serine/threonine protein kinase [Nitrospinae bacterium]|nr:serine/threonine protein kinase [Nitrospinota bacterium]
MAIKHLGRFEIIEEIGSGGMGLVYKGRDPKINRLVALKVVRPALGSKSADQQQAAHRFHVEAQAAGQLSHPNIVTIYDAGEEATPDGTMVYIAMEFLSGRGLDWHINNRTFTNLEEIVNIVRQIAEGLDYAHKRGVIHRDVKPANIIVTEENIPKLTDFGLARLSDSSLTMTGTILGTPNYMSPEQVQGRQVDARSDFFSLTVLLYEMITNEKPFSAESITSVIYKVVNEEPIPPRRLNATLPPVVDAFIKKGLAKNPDSRFQNGQEYIRALNAILTNSEKDFNILGDSTIVIDGRMAPKIPSMKGMPKLGGKTGMYIGGGVGVVLALLVAVFVFSGGGEEKPQQVAKVEPAPAATPKPAPEPVAATSAPVAPVASAPGAAPGTPAVKPEKKEPVKQATSVTPETEKPAPAAGARYGYLTVNSEPDGAEVFINGKFIGSTPINNMKVKSGDLTVKINKKGYKPQVKQITLGTKGSFSAALTRIAEQTGSTAKPSTTNGSTSASADSGALEIFVPGGSVTYVDGREFKTERVHVKNLSTGTHLVYVQFKGRSPYNNRVKIKAGETLRLDLR